VILVVGGLADTVTELVCARLDDCGYPYRLLDLGFYPTGFEVSCHWRDSSVSGYVAGADWKLDVDEIGAVYARYLGMDGRAAPPDVPPEWVPAMYFEYDSGLMAMLDGLPCTVVNRIAGGMSNSSKAYQALLVRECGLLTPPTLVTNDPEAVRGFADEFDGNVVYKSLSGIRSIVRRLQPDQLARLPLLRHGPAQFQAFIPGENVRVHTVGEHVFAHVVHSEAVDYRYGSREGHEVAMEPAALPADVERACLDLAGRLDLLLAGIDLKRTPDGDYYCFEINPSPGFLYYEQQTRQPISAALADLLQNGVRPSAREGAMPPR
jgi:hypothetical protein